MENVKEWNYKVMKRIGEGGYGVVYKCRNLETQQTVAIKMITIKKEYQGVSNYVLTEVSLNKQMEHDNVVRMLDLRNSGKYVYLVFECLDLNLHSLIRSPNFSPNLLVAKAILRQILLGLAYCHSIKVIHRDLYPKNILIDLKARKVKLADFGLARDFTLPPKGFSRRGSEGNSPYKAPELLLDDYKYTTPIDVWAAGCIFVEIAYGRPLFSQCDRMELLDEIFGLFGTPTEITWPELTSLKYLPTFSKYKPMDFAAMFTKLKPPLGSAGIDLLSKLLRVDPDQRITAHDAVNHEYLNDVQDVPFISDRPSNLPCNCFAMKKTPIYGHVRNRLPLIRTFQRISKTPQQRIAQ